MNARQEERPLQQQEDPQPPHIKEEEEEVWISQEGECPVGQEEADVSKFPLTVVSVKTEEHEDKPPESSQLHHSPNVCGEQRLPEKKESSFRMVKEDPSKRKTRRHGPSGVSFSSLTQTLPCKKEEEDSLTPHIKEEEEEHSITQEGDHLEGLEEFPVTGVPVKSDDNEVKGESEERGGGEPPSSSSTQHMTTEADGDHCGGSQADKLLAPLSDSEDTTSHSPDTDDEDSKDDKTCHTDNTHFTSSHCHKTFKNHCDLKRHMRTHTGEKPFTCSIRSKGFVKSSYLKVHMRTHTGERPFPCSTCGKGFTQNQYLKVHMRTHTGEKPFSCSICSKGFVQSNSLKVHMRTHTGEKSHSCSICNRSFCDRSNLLAHMRRHPGEKVLSCSVCGERLSSKYQCKKHKCAGENSSSK
ncbi:zinc finger protein 177-like [Nerophis ophidion]|uniref:zinc finger protein 177-like n=1 Tax=Nerophis ophidion TaxID=159077 RepID=UPI002ADF4063|nr:zinc finger protein 177-like [Nerophis ophidion]